MKHNERDLATAEALAKDLRVDKFLVKTAQIYTDADAEEFLPEDEQYSRYEHAEDELVVKGQPYAGLQGAVVQLDGQLERSGRALLFRQGRRLWHGAGLQRPLF